MDDADLLAWMEIGHRVAPLVPELLRKPDHFLVLAGPGGGYVQIHGIEGGECYAEADSGEWTDNVLTAAQHLQMRDLGWRRPVEHVPRQEHWNYWLQLEAPVDESGW